MQATEHYRLMARYNQWMNRNIYRECAAITEADRKRDLGAFFKSIHGTLNHLLYGDRVWMGRFTGPPFTGVPIGTELYADFDALRTEREAMDARIIDWTGGLTAEWLAAPFTFTSNVDRRTRTMPAWTLVAQIFNHQTHHRGQVTTLMMQLGRDPGVTDIPWLPEFGGGVAMG